GPQRCETATPCVTAPVDQNIVESLLRDRAKELGAHVEFGTQMCGFTQHGTGVDVRLRDRFDEERPMCVRYLVAADGAQSPIRRQIGTPMEVFGESFDMLSMLVEADLRPALAGRTVHMAHLNRPRPRSFLMALDGTRRRWAFGTTDDLETPEPDAWECVELVRDAVGDPELPVGLLPHITGTDMIVSKFAVGAAVAAHYRYGRVFLAGDSAHLMPPTAGFGAATGVADAHNLAWKLAAVVGGQAGDGLLDSYHDERHPVARFTLRQSLARTVSTPGVDSGHSWTDVDAIVDRDSVMMGYHYRSSAVVDVVADAHSVTTAAGLSGEPGTRAPHLWLTDTPTHLSTIDMYGSRFVLLAGEDGYAWMTAAHTLPVQVDAYRLGVDIGGPDAAARHGIGPRGAALVRPDGYVAWRSLGMVPLPTDRLFSVLNTVLSASSAHSPRMV
ncbi:MAG: FAD-dependent monooxygenase, partial [Stackebrandtia sp.]